MRDHTRAGGERGWGSVLAMIGDPCPNVLTLISEPTEQSKPGGYHRKIRGSYLSKKRKQETQDS